MSDHEIMIDLAEKVMGWRVMAVSLTSGVFDSNPGEATGTRHWPNNFNPLGSIADAMEVSEKCGRFDMIPFYDGWMVGDGSAGFSTDEGFVEMQLAPFAIAPTLPRAICLAAIKARA